MPHNEQFQDNYLDLNKKPSSGTGSDKIGTPTDGSYSDGLLPLTPTTRIADAFDYVNQVLLKLAPTPPVNLSTKILSLSGTYSAVQSNTGVFHAVVIDSLTPSTNIVANFGDGEAGVLSSYVDGILTGSRVLIKINNMGTYGDLVITDNSDPYAGQVGKEGFWKQLSAYTHVNNPLNYTTEHNIQMRHSITGNTNLLTFWCDDPDLVTITNESHSLPVINTRYISGVPSLEVGDILSFNFDIVNAVRKHFNATKIGGISSTFTSTNNIAPFAIYNEGSNINILNKTVTAITGVYSENVSVDLQGFNSKGVGGTIYNVLTNARIDTVSDETIRVISGSGTFPTSGTFGGVFDSTKSLKTFYTEELQLINGLYKCPSGDYTGNLPTAGEDYNFLPLNIRWVTFDPINIVDRRAFTLNILNASNFGSSIIISGIYIYVFVVGSKPTLGWIDCNSPYDGVSSPTNNGDSALVYGSSTVLNRRITFGSQEKTGILYIRIGFPSGSNKSFSGITITNFV